MYYLLKGIRLSVWNTKDIKIRGNGLTDINLQNISTQIKFVDTVKYYLVGLGQLSSILDKTEKKLLKKQPLNF